MKKWGFLHCLKVLLFVALAVTVAGFVTKSLWNCLVPELFNGPILNFGQALGLLLLAKIFFGFPFRGRGCGCGSGAGWRGGSWRRKFEEKMASMTPEEREKFKNAWKNKCGPWGASFGEEKGKEAENK